MEYQEVKCRNCGSPMHVAEDAERIRCPYCGTEYVLKSQRNEKNPVRIINYGGRGALFQSYIPTGWDYRVFDESLQECFPSGSPAATWYLFFGNECIIYQFHMHYNLGFACFLTEAVFVLTFFFSLPQDSPGLSCGFSAV